MHVLPARGVWTYSEIVIRVDLLFADAANLGLRDACLRALIVALAEKESVVVGDVLVGGDLGS
jgi:hypothetical protein